MAVECVSTLLGTSSSKAMKPDDLITYITEEAQHCIINNEHTKNTHPVQHLRTAKTQATPRPTAGQKEDAKKVKDQGNETPRKEKRSQKQQQQWK